MRRSHDGEPLGRRDLVGADRRAHVVAEDLGSGAGQRAQAGGLQATQVRLERQPECRRTVHDFERREGVHVHARRGAQGGPRNVEIRVCP